jgi:membrane-associated protease RseP (regulator of RpoE activity)
VEVSQDAGEVVSIGSPGPDLGEAIRLCADVTERLKSLRADQEAAGRELNRRHVEARDALRQLLQELRDGTDRVQQECEETRAEFAALRESGRSLLADFESRAAVILRSMQAGPGQPRSLTGRAEEHSRRSDDTGRTEGRQPSEVRSRFGVAVDPGVVVAEVRPGTPAEVAGLAPGDVITAVDGDSVFSVCDLWDLVQDAADARELVVQVNRGGVVRDVTARLDPASDERRTRLGLTVQPGVVVVETLPGTPAASAGLAPGDVIAAVNGTPVRTGQQFRDTVNGWSGGEFVLQVCRGGETYEIARVG